jgi:NAD-dependent SIR2 family protein deacetylase
MQFPGRTNAAWVDDTGTYPGRVGGVAQTTELAEVVDLLSVRSAVALTGAGLSTDSGIPDYRGPNSPKRSPMTYQEFVSGPVARRRYWARAHLGWRLVSDAAPNAGHQALVEMERSGVLAGLITQNVDGLHEAAGQRHMVALHGRVSRVVCLSCRQVSARADLHCELARLNPGFTERSVVFAPDGDAVLDDVADFRIPDCFGCGGVLKPDVVFFGENVPRERVKHCTAMVARASALLIAGSSLQVMSGLRFVRQARQTGIPVIIINRGPTRGDDLATLKIHEGCSESLAALSDFLCSRRVDEATAHAR